MNLDTLRLFVDTAYKLSFAAVAEAREVNPSSVSRTIAQLEKHLGFRLFQRTTRTMTLTESGKIYLLRVEDILNKLEEAKEQARRVHIEPVGTLRITSSISFGERYYRTAATSLSSALPTPQAGALVYGCQPRFGGRQY